MTESQPFRHLLPLYAVIFLGFAGFALTITLFIPMLMDNHFPLLPKDASISLRTSLSGLLLAMYPLGQFFGSPIIGNLSDNFGRKIILILSLLACAAGFALMALSIHLHQVYLLFLSAFFTGLCESNMAISQAIIADKTEDMVYKTKLMGYVYAACSLGYVVGPLFAGFTGTFGDYIVPFWVTGFVALLLLIWIYYGFKDTYIPNKDTSITLMKSLTSIKSLFNQPKFYKYYIINFSIFFAVQGLYRVVPLYVNQIWSPTLTTYSVLIAYVSLICFITNLLILEPLAKRFPTKTLLASLLLLGGVMIILITIPQHFNWIYLTYGLAVIPTVMALPLCSTWLSMNALQKEQGQVLGNNQALLVLGESTSAAIGGFLAAIAIPLPTIIMGCILLITGIAIIWNKNKH